jgi:hypothetical protein
MSTTKEIILWCNRIGNTQRKEQNNGRKTRLYREGVA